MKWQRGSLVKIDDIGQPAIFIRFAGNKVEVELFGENYLIPRRLVNQVENEAA